MPTLQPGDRPRRGDPDPGRRPHARRRKAESESPSKERSEEKPLTEKVKEMVRAK